MTPTEIPLYQIKSELSKMWQEVTRSSVLTLVVYAPGEDRASRVSATLNALAGQHPSRAIIISAESSATRTEAMATVELHSHALGQSNGLIGDEQITIYLPDAESLRVAEYVTPLLLSDMPVFVWLAAPAPNNRQVVERLVDIGDHLLFDSAAFIQPARDLSNLAQIIQQTRTAVNYKAFHDFAWERAAPWREAVAQCFDPPFLQHLGDLTTVRIGFASDPRWPLQPLPALLLTGWLATQLDWQPTAVHTEANGEIRGEFLVDGRTEPVTISIAPYAVPNATIVSPEAEATTAGTLSQGSLLFVELDARHEAVATGFRVHMDNEFKRAVATIIRDDTPLVPARWMPLDMPTEAALLARQLARFRYDHIYEDAVLAASNFIALRPSA